MKRHDFVYCSRNTGLFRSREDRIDLKIVDAGLKEKAVVVTIETILIDDDDVFEAMELSEFGDVLIWTKKSVWTIRREGNWEKLLFVPRNPPF